MRVLDTILLIDDDDTTNYLNKRLLIRLQVARKIQVANNGEEAIHYLLTHCQALTSEEEDRPELIFLDIKMPVMDGFEFLEEYNKLRPQLGCPSVISMLTSSASNLDINRLQQYGTVSKYLTKPLTERKVSEIMEEFFPEPTQP